MDDKIWIKKIEKGSVIDHIPKGQGKNIINLLNLDDDCNNTLAFISNVNSNKIGKKDIIKIENKYLDEKDIIKVSLVAPDTTYNFVENYKVVLKKKIELPETIDGIIKCPNSMCITNVKEEPVETKFIVNKKSQVELKCIFCERVINMKDVL